MANGLVRSAWSVDSHIRLHVSVSRFLHRWIPFLGRYLAMLADRLLLVAYGVDLLSASIDVAHLSVPHPGGVLLGGNGIVSRGRVAIMAGVKFVGRKPDDANYLALHAERAVFRLGDNVVIGSNSVIIGPTEICDNVMIGAMSLVNRPIMEPGTYAGVPARRISDETPTGWLPASLPTDRETGK